MQLSILEGGFETYNPEPNPAPVPKHNIIFSKLFSFSQY